MSSASEIATVDCPSAMARRRCRDLSHGALWLAGIGPRADDRVRRLAGLLPLRAQRVAELDRGRRRHADELVHLPRRRRRRARELPSGLRRAALRPAQGQQDGAAHDLRSRGPRLSASAWSSTASQLVHADLGDDACRRSASAGRLRLSARRRRRRADRACSRSSASLLRWPGVDVDQDVNLDEVPTIVATKEG